MSWFPLELDHPRLVLLTFSLTFVVIVQHALRKYAAYQTELNLTRVHGCQAPWRLPYRYPLALDLVHTAFSAAKAGQLLQLFSSIIRANGTTFEQKILGGLAIDTVDPVNIDTVLSAQFKDYGMGVRRQNFFPLLGDGIFTQDGPQWKHSRELLRPSFVKSQYQGLELLDAHTEHLLNQVKAAGPAADVDLLPLFFEFTMGTTMAFLFGTSAEELAATDGSRFAESFRVAQDFLARRGRLGDLYWVVGDFFGARKFRRSCQQVHEFIDPIVKRALLKADEKKDENRYVFLDVLVETTRDSKVLRDQLANVLLAGRDTTACLLSWTFRLLVKHPAVLQRLQEEVRTVVGGAKPDKKSLKKMTYLSWVLKEVLRLYPSVPLNSRHAVRATTLPHGGGPDGSKPIIVSEGEAVGYSTYELHRQKHLYGADAEAFRPERWDESLPDDSNLKNIGSGYLPFNTGPRVCLGQEFALFEASYATVRILQSFPNLCKADGKCDDDVGTEKHVVTLVLAPAEGSWIHTGETVK